MEGNYKKLKIPGFKVRRTPFDRRELPEFKQQKRGKGPARLG